MLEQAGAQRCCRSVRVWPKEAIQARVSESSALSACNEFALVCTVASAELFRSSLPCGRFTAPGESSDTCSIFLQCDCSFGALRSLPPPTTHT